MQGHQIPAGYNALTGDQIKQIDPLHIGLNQVAMTLFNTFPHANDFSQGDGVNFIGYRFRGPAPNDKNWYIGARGLQAHQQWQPHAVLARSAAQ